MEREGDRSGGSEKEKKDKRGKQERGREDGARPGWRREEESEGAFLEERRSSRNQREGEGRIQGGREARERREKGRIRL